MRIRRAAPVVGLLVALLTGCGGFGNVEEPVAPSRGAGPTSSATPIATPTAGASPAAGAGGRARWIRGVDASHHQGDIDWRRVAGDRIDFAYLKATEGRSFTDPRFAANARGAAKAGIRVGGYHYFALCSPGAAQAEHFVSVLATARPRTVMPAAIDLELQGNCSQPPAREDLLREIRAFLEVVEVRTDSKVVVYAYPDFEERFGVRSALGRRTWVRRIGDDPPAGRWWIWQRDDSADIAGIEGPADLNVMRP